MKRKSFLSIAFTCALLLSGCMTKTEDIQKNIEKALPKIIQADPEAVTTTEENLSFYLPDDSKILSASENNVAFETVYGDFVIFMNPVETEGSQTNYDIVKDLNKDREVLVDETLNEGNGFQFVYILQTKNKEYEIYVGLGGVKASALVKKKGNLEPAVEQLIKVAKSVKVVSDTDAKEGTEETAKQSMDMKKNK